MPNYFVNGQWLQNQAAEYLIGWPESGTLAEPTLDPRRRNLFHLFFQDDWQVNRRLTLNLGIRYEPHFWGYVRMGRSTLFRPDGRSTTYSNFPSGVITTGDPGFEGKSGIEIRFGRAFAPRVGFAYRLDDQGKTVIRGAWGIFYNLTSTGQDTEILTTSEFPFFHSYSAAFTRGFPAVLHAWLDVPVYTGIPKPELTVPLDPGTASFDPRGTYGGNAGLMSPKLGYVHQWNITFEKEFRPGWLAAGGYLGHRGENLGFYDVWNVPEFRDGTDSWDIENMASRRPLQEYRYQTRAFENPGRGDSAYHAAQVRLQARKSIFQMNSWYTLARTRSHGDGLYWTWRVGHPGALDDRDWGLPSHARVHNFLLVPSWDLPFFSARNDALGKILGGWRATWCSMLNPVNPWTPRPATIAFSVLPASYVQI